MADLISIREWLRLTLWLVGSCVIGALLVTWNAWYRMGLVHDESFFLLMASVSGALVLLWCCLFVFYMIARRMLRPSAASKRFAKVGVSVAWLMLLASFIGVFGYTYHLFSTHESDVYTLLRLGKLTELQERVRLEPELLVEIEEDTGATLLKVAYDAGDPEAVALLLKLGASPKQLCDGKRNPLIFAQNKSGMLGVLLESGLDPDYCAADGVPPLQYAVICHDQVAIDALLDAGACLSCPDHKGRTALMRAIDVEALGIAKNFLLRGANINARDKRGDTPLHKAVRQNSLAGVKLLLSYEADVAAFNHANFTPLHLAALSGNAELIEVLLQNPGLISLCSNEGQTAFECALRARKYETARVLLEKGANMNRVMSDGLTILHVLIDARDYQSVRFLIEEGADVRLPDRNGVTALDMLRERHQATLVRLIEGDSPSDSEEVGTS